MSLMDALPKLGLIANFGVGTDAIDIPAATARGIQVVNTPDVLNDDVADMAIALMLAVWRNILGADHRVRSGSWGKEPPLPLTHRVSGKRVGLLGMGRIGREIADRCAAFKMQVSYHCRQPKASPYPYVASLDELAHQSDCLICVVPGGHETYHMINAEVLARLGPSGLLINVGRGSTVDENALIDALNNGKLGGAGLDVFEYEPNVPEALKNVGERVVLQPHVASSTNETVDDMVSLMIDNIKAYFEGRPVLTPVNQVSHRHPFE